MTKTKKALGKGIHALIPEIEDINISEENYNEVDINLVKPNKDQPRKNFDINKLKELSMSIIEHGILQPIVVSKIKNGYQIIAGERRWRAAQMAGVKKVPVIVRELTEEQIMEIALIENLQREDLNDIEEAVAYKELMDKFKLTQGEIALKLGRSRATITNTLRLLQLPIQIQEMIKQSHLSAGHARAILSVEEELREELSKKIIDNKLSVREAEKTAKNLNNNINNENIKSNVSNNVQSIIYQLQEDVQRVLGTKVKITQSNKKGKIEIQYYDYEDLDRIINKIVK